MDKNQLVGINECIPFLIDVAIWQFVNLVRLECCFDAYQNFFWFVSYCFLIDRTFYTLIDQSYAASIVNMNTFRHVSSTRLLLSLLLFFFVSYLVLHSTSHVARL
jgi:hypothetical protein